jgi:hypothetical protein
MNNRLSFVVQYGVSYLLHPQATAYHVTFARALELQERTARVTVSNTLAQLPGGRWSARDCASRDT